MSATVVLFYLIIGLVSSLFYALHHCLNYWKLRGIPHESPHPLFGNLFGVRTTKTFTAFAQEYYRKFRGTGPFCGVYFLMKPEVFVLDLQLAKCILIKDFHNFADRGFFNNERDDPLTANLFALDGTKWKQLRHKLTSTFTSGKMKYMFPTIVKVANELTDVVGGLTQKPEVLEIRELLARFTTDVIGVCAFGIQCNSLRDPNAEFRRMGRKFFTHPRHSGLVVHFLQTFPKLARTLRMRFIRDELHNFFMRVVHESVALREQQNLKCNDFVDLLIELKNKKSITLENGEMVSGLTMNELAAQCFVFFMAGFETSSTTLGFALYELAQHQHIQDKLRQEVNEVLEKHDQQFSYDSMKELRYHDQVISETLRLHTVVPLLWRVALDTYVVPDNPKYVIEKGMMIQIPACAFHHDPDLYPDPNEFKPERFSADMVAKRDSVEWLPFGDGPRNCIGMRFGQMQTRIGLALLIKNFKFSICEQTKIPLEFDPKLFIRSAKDGIYLRVEKI